MHKHLLILRVCEHHDHAVRVAPELVLHHDKGEVRRHHFRDLGDALVEGDLKEGDEEGVAVDGGQARDEGDAGFGVVRMSVMQSVPR